jgi:SAM-dependent methyltransferase
MLAPVDEPLLHALRLDAPLRIADIGCGGGGTTLEILRRAPTGSVVHGFDISPVLVDAARQRVPPDARGIAFVTADAATATPSAPYDRLASRFGLMFFPDPPAALANLARWLAPGGRFAFAVWGRPADNPWLAIARDAVAEVVDVPQPDAAAPGPFRYAEADTLLRLLDGAGFRDLECHEWHGRLAIGGGGAAPEAAAFALDAFSTFAELLAESGEEARRRAERSLTARFAQHERDGAVRLGASVHVVSGGR